ncbi:ATP-binding protein [Flavobacterium sp. J27]|uniref:sensor histidine kinase n=1 Tax=Flavobacterium sp. J27 TaxID=2060419 RepID=UPI0010327B74|nr:ATP-binding protein [Flavobacterium sp. J27]
MNLTDRSIIYNLIKMIEEVQDYAIILLDKNGNIQNWNLGAEKIKGYKPHEIIGKNFSLFYTPEDISNNKHLNLLATARKNGRASDIGWRVKKNNDLFWGSITITAIHDENHEIIGFGKVTHDLTETRKTELEREQKNKELEQFTYIASHDLQEPLRTISNYIQIIEEDYGEKFDDQGREFLTIIDQASNRMKALVGGLLDHSRIGRDPYPSKISLSKILKDNLTDLQALISSQNATIDYPKELPEIYGYPNELRQLFQNLITNAIKFTKPETTPHIQITCKKIENYWQFAITDNGIGIDSKNYDKIFTIFKRTENTINYDGYGIGLANCKKIVALHGGKIWVESKLGQGSTFYFNL